MITDPPEQLTTERLLLRKPSLEDAQSILDSYAQDPGQLTDKMVVIQSHRDAVHAELLKLEPLADVTKAALDVVYSIGDSCSQASSEKKRRAQVQIVVKDLLEKQEIAAVFLARVERSYRHLEKQHETISRILSWHQQQFPKSLAADYLQNKAPVPTPQMPAQAPAPTAPTRPQAEAAPGAQPPKQVENLDKFSPQKAPPLQAGKPAGKFSSGFTDGSLDF